MHKETRRLIATAKRKMSKSFDHIHDKKHAKRVALYARNISNALNLTEVQTHSLILAAWWHDTGRTITKKPSIIWMRAVDDSISAFLLWREARRHHFHSASITGAIKLLLCKSLGTGKIFTHLFLKKEDHILLHILKDADTLDVLSLERVNQLCVLAQQSKINKVKYKLTIWWFLHSKEFEFRTQQAKKFFESILQDFLLWTQEAENFTWHEENFGIAWIENKIEKGKLLLQEIRQSLTMPS